MKPSLNPPPLLQETVDMIRRAFLGIMLFSMCINLLLLTTPLYMLQVFERVLASRNIDTLIMLSLIAGGALLVMAFLDGLRGLILNRVGAWFDRRLGGETLTGGIDAALRTNNHTGIQGLRDIAIIRGFLTGPGMMPLMDAPWTPLFIGIMFLLHPWLGILAIIGAVVLLGLAIANELATRNLQSRASQAAMSALHQAEAMVRNAEAVDAMGMRDGLIGKWKKVSEPAIDLQTRISNRVTIITACSKFIRLGLQAAVMGIGAYLVIGGELGAGAMIAGAVILSRALAPVEQAIGCWRGLLVCRAAYGRLKNLLDQMPESHSSMPLPAPVGHLTVEKLSFGLPGDSEPILKDINFNLEPGKILAVMGPSASGKTTLSRLLVGNFRPTFGAVRLDGMNVYEWDTSDLGPHVGYLPQNAELFEGSIRENIARMTDNDPDAVIKAAKTADVHEMILRMKQGYDTQIGNGGANLSGGQRQRIALARAIYGEPRLLVLDEPDANLDRNGEVALLAALRTLKQLGCAIVFISHRPSILKVADDVMVLEDGKVSAYGPSRIRDSAGSDKANDKGAPPKIRVIASTGDKTALVAG